MAMRTAIAGAIRKVQINHLKRKARNLYHAIERHYDRYDCGQQMMDMLSPRGPYLKGQFNKVMDKLAKLDPNTPKERMK